MNLQNRLDYAQIHGIPLYEVPRKDVHAEYRPEWLNALRLNRYIGELVQLRRQAIKDNELEEDRDMEETIGALGAAIEAFEHLKNQAEAYLEGKKQP